MAISDNGAIMLARFCSQRLCVFAVHEAGRLHIVYRLWGRQSGSGCTSDGTVYARALVENQHTQTAAGSVSRLDSRSPVSLTFPDHSREGCSGLNSVPLGSDELKTRFAVFFLFYSWCVDPRESLGDGEWKDESKRIYRTKCLTHFQVVSRCLLLRKNPVAL